MQMNSLKDFVKAIPDNLNTITERARYLYLELGQRSFYDPQYKYFMGDEEDFSEYTHKPYHYPNIIICTTLAKQFVELLQMAQIQSELVYKDGHYLANFYDENEVCHLADITNDLKNIQFNCSTSYFGKETLDIEKLKEIDLKLGYITEDKSYSNDYWYVVRDVLQSNELPQKERLEIVLQSLSKFGDLTKPR